MDLFDVLTLLGCLLYTSLRQSERLSLAGGEAAAREHPAGDLPTGDLGGRGQSPGRPPCRDPDAGRVPHLRDSGQSGYCQRAGDRCGDCLLYTSAPKTYNEKIFTDNLTKFDQFAAQLGIPADLMMVPSTGYLMEEVLPLSLIHISSAKMSLGWFIMSRAQAHRCFWPPEI